MSERDSGGGAARVAVVGRRGVGVRVALSRVEVVAIVTVLAVGGVVGVTAMERLRREAKKVECLRNLETIGRGMRDYVAQSGGMWPYVARLPSREYHTPPWPSLPEVLSPFMRGQAEAFRCPKDVRELEADHPLRERFGARTSYFETEGTSYEWALQELYAGQPVGRDPLAKAEGLGLGPADQPIIWEYRPFHGRLEEAGSLNILYADFRARPQRGDDGRRAGVR